MLITAVNPITDSSGNRLTLLPNPAHTTVVVKYPLSSSKAYLSFYDLSGRRMKQIEVAANTEEWEVRVGNLAPGIYKVDWNDGKKNLTATMMVW